MRQEDINAIKRELEMLNPIAEPKRMAFILIKLVEMLEQQQREIADLKYNQQRMMV